MTAVSVWDKGRLNFPQNMTIILRLVNQIIHSKPKGVEVVEENLNLKRWKKQVFDNGFYIAFYFDVT